jgi:arginyl-tRNA synthetase
MTFAAQIKVLVWKALNEFYPEVDMQSVTLTINHTKSDYVGDYTVVLFPFVKLLRVKPDALGTQLGEHLIASSTLFSSFDIVGGFLNLTLSEVSCTNFLGQHYSDSTYGRQESTNRKVMVEYSSPNTNKPLHFGHLRNIFLGAAISEILAAVGNDVVKANLINDRGIHICKSMLAWQKLANGATPLTTGTKGDHLVGDYYVKFNDLLKAQVAELIAAGIEQKDAEKQAPIMQEAQEMLRLWEAGDTDVRQLWETMNGWVYEGFEKSYDRLGVNFQKVYYESNTYLLGKELVEAGLKNGVLFTKENGSIWVDLTNDGLDEKLLLRGDGTSVYITQDLGTAKLKFEDYQLDESIYVIADEQNYHMQVLKLILKKLGEPCADTVTHLSYGMVELPTGKMKSREGTVVDADDMVDEMIALSKQQTEQNGKTEGFTQDELSKLYETIGLGALKFYLLRVEPKKKMIFDPKESIDLHGFTATFVQYAHARICSMLRKENVPYPATRSEATIAPTITAPLLPLEKQLILKLEQYPTILQAAAAEYNPSELCNYCFQLAQLFNSFYDAHSIARAENEEKKQLRLMIVAMTASIIQAAMKLLGINVPEKM